MKYKIKAAVASRKGDYRASNEDNFLFGDNFLKNKEEDVCLKSSFKLPATFAVFDGMGGSGYGREASFTAAQALYHCSRGLGKYKKEELSRKLEEWISLINQKVYSLTEQGRKTGCTLAMGYLHEQGIFLANVGDSRIYRFHENKLEQLSEDHNQARDLMRLGMGAKRNKGKNALTQYIGMSPEEVIIEPCFRTLEYDSMLLLLCSDGLDAAFGPGELEELLSMKRRLRPKRLARLLVDEAMKRGSRDNITAMIIKIDV